MPDCKLCERPVVQESPKDKRRLCSDPKEHEGKWQINELLKKLKNCEPSEESEIIEEIKKIEESLNLEEKYRVDFTAPNVVEKFDLEVS